MYKKILAIIGIIMAVIASIFILYNNETDAEKNNDKLPNNNDATNYDDSVWLKVAVQGENGDKITINDKKLHILVGLASYDPSKIGSCPYAEISVQGCGVSYVGNTDDGGFATIPVHFTEKGTLTIACKYKNYEKTITTQVE